MQRVSCRISRGHWRYQLLDWNDGRPRISVLDDGCGMSEDTLVEAMRFGGTGPAIERAASDLGRFGLGLKTASLCHCRLLTVASKREKRLSPNP